MGMVWIGLTVVALMGLLFLYAAAQGLAANAVGGRTELIRVGMGPTLWKTTWRGVVIELALVPIAASTKFVSEDELDFPEDVAPDDSPPESGVPFTLLPISSRAIVLLSGPGIAIAIGAGLLLLGMAFPKGLVVTAPDESPAVRFPHAAVPNLAIVDHAPTASMQADLFRQTFARFVWRLATFQSLDGWGGPAGAVATWAETGRHSIGAWISSFGVIAFGLGLTNLLPVPTFNGGYLIQLAIEGTIGRLSHQAQVRLAVVSILILIYAWTQFVIRDLAWFRALRNA